MKLNTLLLIGVVLVITPILGIVMIYTLGSKLPIEFVQSTLPKTMDTLTDIAKISVGAVVSLLGTLVSEQKKNDQNGNTGTSKTGN